ncbi:MAG TPA: hemolysin III family protein, partial [Microvirga sp.]|nr:hemolysin III family protein [Microvirga sp.]
MRWHYDKGELLADGIIHGLGILFGFIAIIALCVIAAWTVDPLEFTAVLIYGAALLTVLIVSALYNLWPASPMKWILRRFD